MLSVRWLGRRGAASFILISLALALTAATAALSLVPPVRQHVPAAFAVTCEGNLISCPPPPYDSTRTSSVTVTHVTSASSVPVEPNTTDTWEVGATYASGFNYGGWCSCVSQVYTAIVSVSRTAGGWSAVCESGCSPTTGPILSVSVCSGSSCGSQVSGHGWQYQLLVDVLGLWTAGPQLCGATIHSVTYSVLDIDPGNVVDVDECSEDETVYFADNVDGVVDTDMNSAARCPYSCSVDGASIALQYDY